jgi:Icc-related predicted phosphoesterase
LIPYIFAWKNSVSGEGQNYYEYSICISLNSISESKQLKEQLEMIPEDVDILITHGPPKGFNDAQKFVNSLFLVKLIKCDFRGCEDLTEIVMKKKPRFHVFGHIHQSHGVHFYKHNSKEQTTFINAAYLNSLFLPSHLPGKY